MPDAQDEFTRLLREAVHIFPRDIRDKTGREAFWDLWKRIYDAGESRGLTPDQCWDQFDVEDRTARQTEESR